MSQKEYRVKLVFDTTEIPQGPHGGGGPHGGAPGLGNPSTRGNPPPASSMAPPAEKHSGLSWGDAAKLALSDFAMVKIFTSQSRAAVASAVTADRSGAIPLSDPRFYRADAANAKEVQRNSAMQDYYGQNPGTLDRFYKGSEGSRWADRQRKRRAASNRLSKKASINSAFLDALDDAAEVLNFGPVGGLRNIGSWGQEVNRLHADQSGFIINPFSILSDWRKKRQDERDNGPIPLYKKSIFSKIGDMFGQTQSAIGGAGGKSGGIGGILKSIAPLAQASGLGGTLGVIGKIVGAIGGSVLGVVAALAAAVVVGIGLFQRFITGVWQAAAPYSYSAAKMQVWQTKEDIRHARAMDANYKDLYPLGRAVSRSWDWIKETVPAMWIRTNPLTAPVYWGYRGLSAIFGWGDQDTPAGPIPAQPSNTPTKGGNTGGAGRSPGMGSFQSPVPQMASGTNNMYLGMNANMDMRNGINEACGKLRDYLLYNIDKGINETTLFMNELKSINYIKQI